MSLLIQDSNTDVDPASLSADDFFTLCVKPQTLDFDVGMPQLKLKTAYYPYIDTQDIPRGYAEVEVLIDDNGVEFKSAMTAGQVGMRVCSSGNKETSMTGQHDVICPVAGWWIFTKKSPV